MPEYPLISKNSYGKGSATYIATQYFANYFRKPSCKVRRVMLGMLRELGVEPYAALAVEDEKAQSALITSKISDESDNVNIITVTNTDYEAVEDSLILPDGDYTLVENLGKHIINKENGKTVLRFALGALETVAICKNKEGCL